MTTVNINRKVSDSYYRYKMPKIQAKVEGRGNGIKTVVVNLLEVSKALHRPPLYPLKYIGCELGAQTIADIKNERFIVNGAHDADKLQNILDSFIEKYVLCTNCSNPETILSVYPKKDQISMRCIACGHTCRLPTVHRISTYILKNPPPTSSKDKHSHKKTIKQNTNHSTSSTTTIENKSNGTTADTDTILEASAGGDGNSCNIGSDEGGCDNSLVIDDNDDEVQWNIDSSEAAIKQRQLMLSSHLRAMTLDDDTNKPIHQKLEILRQFIQEKLKLNPNLNIHYDDIVCEARRLEVENKAVFAISSAIFDQNIVKQLSQHHVFLRNFCDGHHRIQKYLLASIERIIDQHMDHLLKKVPVIFKIMFEADIIDEEVFFDWDTKSTSRYVSNETFEKIKKAAFKFMDWLKNAEEESSDSENKIPTFDNKLSSQSSTITKTDSTTNNNINNAILYNNGVNNHYSNVSGIVNGDVEDDNSDLNIDDI